MHYLKYYLLDSILYRWVFVLRKSAFPDTDRVLPMIMATPSNCSNGQLFTKWVLFRSSLTCVSKKGTNFLTWRLVKLYCLGENQTEYVADCWQVDYNRYRRRSLDASGHYMAPAVFVATCLGQGSATLHLPQDKKNSYEILS